MAAFPTTVATDSDLYIAVNATSTQLTDNPLSNSATTVNVTDATAFPTVGFISIDNEIIKYTGKTGTSFTGCTRGADGTSATSHVQNSQVFHNVIAAHHNAMKDDLIATEQFISDLIGRTNTQVRTPDGTAAAPVYSFAADLDTGIYRPTSNQIGFSSTGTLQATFDATSYQFGLTPQSGATKILSIENLSNTANSNSRLKTTVGGASAGNPDLLFSISGVSNYVMGIANADSDLFVVSNSTVLGTNNVFKIDGPNTQCQFRDGTASIPGIGFMNDTNTGIFRITTDDMGFATGGVQRLHISTSDIVAALPLGMGANKITNLAAATANGDAVRFEQNKVIQVVTSSITTDDTTTSSTYQSSSLTLSITPTSASNKIVILISSIARNANPNVTNNSITIFRDATNLAAAATQTQFSQLRMVGVTGFTNVLLPLHIHHTDSPATTSSVTYTLKFASTDNTTLVGIGNGNRATITLMEVAP